MKVFSTWKLPDEAKKILSGFEIAENSSPELLEKEAIAVGMESADAILTLLTDTIDREMIAASGKLKIIANVAAGYNNIDVREAEKRGIIVTNTPGILADATADLVAALILSTARKIVAADKFMREKKFTGWRPDLFLGLDMNGAVLGIYGMGQIGREVAKRIKSFGTKVIYHNRHRLDEAAEKQLGVSYVDFEALLKKSDIVCVMAPLTDQTRGRFGRKEFSAMKPGALFINAGRGGIMSEEELVNSLENGHLGGAGLDVYEFEPMVSERLLKMDNTVLLPHIGSAGEKTRDKMFILAAENVARVLKGQSPLTPVSS